MALFQGGLAGMVAPTEAPNGEPGNIIGQEMMQNSKINLGEAYYSDQTSSATDEKPPQAPLDIPAAAEDEAEPEIIRGPHHGSVIQISNISPGANLSQMVTLFSFIGKVEDVRFYPLDESMAYGSRICYIKYEDGGCCAVAQHMTNTIFIDRALIVVPLPTDIIPEERIALDILTTSNALSGSLQSGTMGLLAQHLPQIVGVNSLGMPQLASSLDPVKLEEIRRTIYIGNLSPSVTPDQLLAFFSGVGEIKYVKICGEETAPFRCAYIEFSEITAISTALQYSGLILGGLPIKIMFSKTAILKPETERKESKKETEKSSRVSKSGSSRRSRSRSPSRRRSRSRSASRRRSRRSKSRSSSRSRVSRRRHSRSKSRDRRRRRSRTRSRSRSPSSKSKKSRSSRGRSRSRSPDDSRRRRDTDRRDRSRDRDSVERSSSKKDRRSTSPSSRKKHKKSKDRDSSRKSSSSRAKEDSPTTAVDDENKKPEDAATEGDEKAKLPADERPEKSSRSHRHSSRADSRSPRKDGDSDGDESRSKKHRKKSKKSRSDDEDNGKSDHDSS